MPALTAADKQFARTISGVRAKRTKFEALLDDIKDEIDALGDLKSKKKCREGAQDLIDYIELHYLHRE